VRRAEMATPDILEKHAARVAKARPSWARGPWDTEPDRLEWKTAAGLPALLVRTDMGHLCGYVAVPPGHPLYGKDDSADLVGEIPCHGGVTYASRCAGAICHVPAPGEPDDVWWFGFDCAHCGDLSPSSAGFLAQRGYPRANADTYRTAAYVRSECEAMAEYLTTLTARSAEGPDT
jgi:hypothetical protein